MKRLFIISGCNGAGKTTASYSILPEILDCVDFVNVDEIAKGLSPFKPESASIQAGRLMLTRIKMLIEEGRDFAFETTLSTRCYKNLVINAQKSGYQVMLLFFFLRSSDLAVKRVETRVKEGGHDVREEIIRRRYDSGLKNFFDIYAAIVNEWIFIDNSGGPSEIIAQRNGSQSFVKNEKEWKYLLENYKIKKNG